MNASHEIKTIEEFRGVAGLPAGVVVVTDTATGNKVHRTSCRYVTEENFTAKVIDGGSKNGRYFHYLRYEDAAQETGASWCQVCG
jgi:hypothetical protein